MNYNHFPPDLKGLLSGAGTKCLNCARPKKEGKMVCPRCEEAGRKLDALLEEGITVEYADGTTELLGGTKNPRKSTRYGKKS